MLRSERCEINRVLHAGITNAVSALTLSERKEAKASL